MSSPVIKVENLAKQYRLGQVGTGSLSHDINRLWHRARGKEDPYLKIGEVNKREAKGTSDYVWALKDINFDIGQGDRVGIIGHNGAGKSTLLKILSRTTSPTSGAVKIKGRVASLLEVGTGFHPDLSGRDNIFLNGAILGMTRRDIKSLFDEIVDFAGVERYIDTPVKRYSSGMYVRLAFAVAAHLQSDILIVDEVLAVGDAEFQKKCIGKMGEVSEGQGKTVLYVSHNMGSILQLCNQCILLSNGEIETVGVPETIIHNNYHNSLTGKYSINKSQNSDIYFKEISTCNIEGKIKKSYGHKENIYLRVKIGINKINPNQNLGIALLNRDKKRVFTVNHSLLDFDYKHKDEIMIDFIIEGGLIAPMDYSFLLALNNKIGTETYHWIEDICNIKVYDDGTDFAFAEGMDYGCIILNDKWRQIEI